MRPSRPEAPARIARYLAAVTVMVIACFVVGMFWAASEGDTISRDRQLRTVLRTVDGALDQLAQEQETVAIWDDPLTRLRAPRLDEAWMDENIGVWLNYLFHHDEIFVLGPDNAPRYAAIAGARVDNAAYAKVAGDLAGLLGAVRGRDPRPATAHDRLPARPVHAESRLRTSAKAVHATRLLRVKNRPAAASIMVFQPSSGRVAADPVGREYLLVSVRYLDGPFVEELEHRSLIDGARFSLRPDGRAHEQAVPIRTARGDLVGYFVWRPELPGQRSMRLMLPLTIAVMGIIVAAMTLLARSLARSRASLERTVAELRESEAVAREQTSRAEVANAAKSDFLATISHEIRTPMNAVVSAAHFLRQSELAPSQEEHVRMLQEASGVLLSLVNDVLDLSRIEAGKLVLEPAPVNLATELEGAVALWGAPAQDKALSLALHVAPDVPAHVMLDPLRLKQILFNLVSNSIKFTDEGGVEIRTGIAPDGRIAITVTDTGIGLTAEALERIFEAFEQADSGSARRYGGSGLGLAISRRLAGIMGGELSAQSEPGRGSTFRLALPCVAAEAGQLADAHPDETPVVDLSELRVLLAEDHPMNQRVVELLLEPFGIAVTIAKDGQEAVEAAAREVFDVVLMDMQMPRMDGLEATRRLMDGLNAATPVIALTANAMPQHREMWRAVGVDILISKPIDPRQLIAALTRAAALRKAAAERPTTTRAAGYSTIGSGGGLIIATRRSEAT